MPSASRASMGFRGNDRDREGLREKQPERGNGEFSGRGRVKGREGSVGKREGHGDRR